MRSTERARVLTEPGLTGVTTQDVDRTATDVTTTPAERAQAVATQDLARTTTDLATALDELAQVAATTQDAARATTALAAAVVDLETAAGAGLGVAAGDPLVLLQRRLGRVHRLLLDAPAGVDAADIGRHVDALRRTCTEPQRHDAPPSSVGAAVAPRVLSPCDAA
jgi:hypothetical protein